MENCNLNNVIMKKKSDFYIKALLNSLFALYLVIGDILL